MEHDLPSDFQNNDFQYPESNEKRTQAASGSCNFSRSQKPFDGHENSHTSAYHANTAGEGVTMPSFFEDPIPRPTRKNRPSTFFQPLHSTRVPMRIPAGDSEACAPSQPFEEVGPASNVRRAYLDESGTYDTDVVGKQRGEVNILLVFAGIFSAVVTAFIIQSSARLQPDYQQISALLLFDQINIQRALANGTSLDGITTSSADPTAPFTPKPSDSWVNGL
ncbi:hypothetical protein DFS33DRAFT_1124861 [Desarmillaria ectypa]|nr:hypothetical protein DFS33DRAFT_1124861 [Desarmillaria ectypa]